MDDPDTILSELRARRQRHAQRTAEQLEDMQREVAAFSGSPLARHDSEPVLSPRIARRTPSRPVAEQSDDELRAQLAALKREEPRLAAPAERRAAAAEAAADRLRAELAVADREVRASRAAREQLLHAEQRAHVSGVAQASVLAELAAAREGAAALREQLRTREGALIAAHRRAEAEAARAAEAAAALEEAKGRLARQDEELSHRRAQVKTLKLQLRESLQAAAVRRSPRRPPATPPGTSLVAASQPWADERAPAAAEMPRRPSRTAPAPAAPAAAPSAAAPSPPRSPRVPAAPPITPSYAQHTAVVPPPHPPLPPSPPRSLRLPVAVQQPGACGSMATPGSSSPSAASGPSAADDGGTSPSAASSRSVTPPPDARAADAKMLASLHTFVAPAAEVLRVKSDGAVAAGSPDVGAARRCAELSSLAAAAHVQQSPKRQEEAAAAAGGPLRVGGSAVPGSTVVVEGWQRLAPAALARVAAPGGGLLRGAAVWWRVLPAPYTSEEPLEDSEYFMCSAEDVGCTLRVECADVSATSAVVRPKQAALELLLAKVQSGGYEFKLRDGSVLILQPTQLKLKLEGVRQKEVHSYAGGTSIRLVRDSETAFELELPATAGRPERAAAASIVLHASTRQQRDTLRLAFAAFAWPGWLDAAIAGAPPAVCLQAKLAPVAAAAAATAAAAAADLAAAASHPHDGPGKKRGGLNLMKGAGAALRFDRRGSSAIWEPASG